MSGNDSIPYFRPVNVGLNIRPKVDTSTTDSPKVALRSKVDMSDSALVSTMLSQGDPEKVKAMADRCADDPNYRNTLPNHCNAAIKAVSLFGFKKQP